MTAQRLRRGDTIGIIAPSQVPDRAVYEENIRCLERQGYRVKRGRNLYKATYGYLAAETEHRRLKAQARAGRGLKEERCEDLAVALVCVGLGVVDDVIGRGDHFVDLLGAQL